MLTIRQQIISDQQVKELIAKLTAQPDNVAAQQQAMADAEFQLKYFTGVKDAEAALKNFEREVLFEVRGVVDDKGKMVFGNEDARDSECQRRMRDSEHLKEFAQLDGALRIAFKQRGDLEMTVARINNSLRYMIDQSYGLKAVAEIVAGLCHEENTKHGLDQIARFQTFLDNEKGI